MAGENRMCERTNTRKIVFAPKHRNRQQQYEYEYELFIIWNSISIWLIDSQILYHWIIIIIILIISSFLSIELDWWAPRESVTISSYSDELIR